MSNEVINQSPSIERAKKLELQAKEGLSQVQLGQEKTIIACHAMRDTKAYTTLGFDSYYAWGESTLNLKKSRLNELALAGEGQQELLIGVENTSEKPEAQIAFEDSNENQNNTAAIDYSNFDSEGDEVDNKDVSDILAAKPVKPITTVSDLPEITTPQLVALAKAPKGERLAVLDKVVVETKAEDKQITTSIIKEAVKASAELVEDLGLSAHEKAVAIKKQHKSAMGKVNKLTEALNGLDTTQVDGEEVENWKVYLDEVKLSISVLEKQLGYE